MIHFPNQESASKDPGEVLQAIPHSPFEVNSKYRRNLITVASENSVVLSHLIQAGKWTFFSNKIVCYWPFSLKSSFQLNHNKYLSFKLPNLPSCLSLIYIILNIFYVVHYFYFQFSVDAEALQPFDLVLITIWDLMVIVSVAAQRVYGILKLSQFENFWDKVLQISEQFVALTSANEVELKLKEIRKWSRNWILIFFLFGIIDCSAVIYHYNWVSKDRVMTTVMFEYLEMVICMHNSSSLVLIFFIKIMTYGYTICEQKLTEISKRESQNFAYYEDRRDKPSSFEGSSSIESVFKLADDLEIGVNTFNKLFSFSLFLEAVLSFWQVLFSLYFLHITPVNHFAFGINMAVPILTYPACLVSLCVNASKLTAESQKMLSSFQNLPVKKLSQDDCHKIQVIVTRLSSTPPTIQVSQLFQIRESLLGSALNNLATYFIVFVNTRQFVKPS